MLIWNIWKHYHHFVNHIFVICVKQFVMKSMMLIMFYSGLFLLLSFIHFVSSSIFLFFFICLFSVHPFTHRMTTHFLVCYVYYLVILHIHIHSSRWLYTQIASTHCWNTVTVNYLSIFDDRCAVIYFMSKLRCCVMYPR